MYDYQQTETGIHHIRSDASTREEINALLVKLKEIEMTSEEKTPILLDLSNLSQTTMQQIAQQLRLLLDKELATAQIAIVMPDENNTALDVSLRTVQEREQIEYFTDEALAQQWLELRQAPDG